MTSCIGDKSFDIELIIDAVLELDIDFVRIQIRPTLLHSLVVHILQHLELVFRTSADGSQRNRNGQTDHACVRNPHPHGVLQDVGTQPHLYLLGQAT